MRFILAGGALLLLGALSCKKEPVARTVDLSTPAFGVQGVAGMEFIQTPFSGQQTARQEWQVVYNHGDARRVALSVVGLPAEITSSITAPAGYPNFETTHTLTNKGAKPGTYAAELLAQREGDAAPERYPLPITVTGTSSCPDYYAALTMNTNTSCFSGNFRDYTITFSRPDPNKDTLLMHNFLGDGRALKVVFNCSDFTLSSPTQSFGDTTYRVAGRAEWEIASSSRLPAFLKCTFYRKAVNMPPMECYPKLMVQQ